jgi:hypothetical protein
MIKLNASYSKKVPADQEYSSKSFLACVEVELPTGASSAELQQKIHETFRLVEQSVEDEIAGNVATGATQNKQRQQGQSGAQDGTASTKQISYLLDLGKAQEKPLSVLNQEANERFGVLSIYQLNRKDCSKYIEELKAA